MANEITVGVFFMNRVARYSPKMMKRSAVRVDNMRVRSQPDKYVERRSEVSLVPLVSAMRMVSAIEMPRGIMNAVPVQTMAIC